MLKIRRTIQAVLMLPMIPYMIVLALIGGDEVASVCRSYMECWRRINEEE